MNATPSRETRTARFESLDGLRGVAALVVVIGHVLLVFPRLATVAQQHSSAGGWAWWFADTPLRLLWNGYGSVLVFFVLSGFVLTVRRHRTGLDWIAYYPSRMLRLYLPVWAAVLICVVLARGVYDWSGTSRGGVLRDLVLVRGADGLDLPIWSLQWEVLFSLLLPLYVLFARLRGDLWAWKLGLLLAVIGVGLQSEHQTLIFLPVFALGAVLAVGHERLPDVTVRGSVAVALLVAVTIVTLDARSIAASAGASGRAAAVVAQLSEIVGAALAVWCALSVRGILAMLRTPVSQWLGSRSFSLYLAHWPVVALLAHAVGIGASRVAVVLALPVALLVAEAFHRIVERPTHQLSRRMSAVLRARSVASQPVPT